MTTVDTHKDYSAINPLVIESIRQALSTATRPIEGFISIAGNRIEGVCTTRDGIATEATRRYSKPLKKSNKERVSVEKVRPVSKLLSEEAH